MSPVFNNDSINRNKLKAKEHQLELMDAPGGYCAKLWAEQKNHTGSSTEPHQRAALTIKTNAHSCGN